MANEDVVTAAPGFEYLLPKGTRYWGPGGTILYAGGVTDEDRPTSTPPVDPLYDPKVFEEMPAALWGKLLGLPGAGRSPYQEWQGLQYAPTYATFKAGDYLRNLRNPAASPGEFGKYIGTQGYGGARGEAGGLWQQGRGLPLEKQNILMDILGENLDDFILNVLRSRYSAPVAKSLAATVGGYKNQFLGETGGGAQASFLDYLTQKYNLV